jgi:hypothetical protein
MISLKILPQSGQKFTQKNVKVSVVDGFLSPQM